MLLFLKLVQSCIFQYVQISFYESRNCLEVMQSLLRMGLDPNSVDKMGHSALHHAVFEGQPDILKLLLDNGAEINQQVSI